MDKVNLVLAKVRDVLDAVRDTLQGEPLRAISYGSAVVIYLVARASGQIADVSLDQALVQAGAAAAIVVSVVETARRYVSPASKA